MSGLTTGHVGDLGAALVDDQLEPAMRELVLRHMIGCSGCRAEVEEQRQLKARLAALTEPGLPMGLFGRLSALKTPSVPRDPDGSDVEELTASRSSLPVLSVLPVVGVAELTDLAVADGRPLGRSAFSSLLGDAHRGRRLLAGAASLLLVGVGTAYAAASDGQLGAPTQPSATVFTTTDASDVTSSIPLNDPAFTAMTASFGR